MLISEYQTGNRNARVYKTTTGTYMVVLYDGDLDSEDSKPFQFIDMAEDFAEDWVNGDVAI